MMGKRVTKSARKFIASGQLKKAIQARHKHQQTKKKFEKRRGNKGKPQLPAKVTESDEDEDEEVEVEVTGNKLKGMSVDDFLGAGFMEGGGDEEEDPGGADSDEGEDEEELEDDNSLPSVDDLDDEGAAHLIELSELAKKDPEFYKYLQENDRELLEFDPDEDDLGSDKDEEAEDVNMNEVQETKSAPVLTKMELQRWQKSLLKHRSLRAWRKLIIAFRSAAHMNDEDRVLGYTIENSSIYNKLVTTTLKYTPIVLQHHVPYKEMANGKFKQPTQTAKFKTLQKLILAYFHNAVHLISQLTDNDLLHTAYLEITKVIPYIITSRKTAKAFLTSCLETWSTAEDRVRIVAILAIRRFVSSGDESIIDSVFKGLYQKLVSACKSTTTHSLPFINLMKNSASEIYIADHGTAYQHAFKYIRQLAILLRQSIKIQTKDAYKQVYNWQYVHCVDFWSLVLARACGTEAKAERGGEASELAPLVYPLVQVTTGAVKLISNSRSYPYHFHLIKSLIHLVRHTHTYIPLAPYLLPIITSTLSTGKPKSSTLRPLDMETNIRAPQQLLQTHVYEEGLIEEATYLLGDYLSTRPIMGSIAFPEVVTPIVVTLRRALKTGKTSGGSAKSKEIGMVRSLVDRVEESAKATEKQRLGVRFGPGDAKEVDVWEGRLNIEETPLGKYMKVQKKAREKKRKFVEKARDGENEMLED
ncbi:Noc2-domain-containing protein [Thelephora ganbajun]|uniref:Noc2-domain-containing protein n=1 Tax=Thelephora ganbajun TaxID=370292 RepID=A0ACB6ZJK2_THEGA|nr:Noc2-domain-containing protein [Thelephora ganbajun]